MKFNFATIHVANLEASIRFYEEVIGLKVARRFPAGPNMEIAFMAEAGMEAGGAAEIELPNGKKLLVVQLLGRLFMEAVDCPAQAIEKLLKNYTLGRNVSAILVDMHAEATSEKLAMGYFLDGRVSAVAGTHTHVPTADARILPKGTAYITDVGMCGNYESVLGFEVEEPVNRLNRRYTGGRLVPSKGPGTLFGIAVETDDATGLAKTIEQIRI